MGERALWFFLGFAASSLVHAVLTTTPDVAIANLNSWFGGDAASWIVPGISIAIVVAAVEYAYRKTRGRSDV